MRPANFCDLTGQKFGKLTPTEYLGNNYWMCACECGSLTKKKASHLKDGVSKSCGCYNKELMLTKFRTHGLSKHPLRNIHNAIMSRCYNEKQKTYKHYGGRGILVCERWHTFKNFYDDMIAGYKKGLSIERENVNGNYEPSNCRWATHYEQVRNRTDNHFLEYNGQKMILNDWAKKYGIRKATLWARINSGWDIATAISTPTLQTWNKKKKNKLQNV